MDRLERILLWLAITLVAALIVSAFVESAPRRHDGSIHSGSLAGINP